MPRSKNPQPPAIQPQIAQSQLQPTPATFVVREEPLDKVMAAHRDRRVKATIPFPRPPGKKQFSIEIITKVYNYLDNDNPSRKNWDDALGGFDYAVGAVHEARSTGLDFADSLIKISPYDHYRTKKERISLLMDKALHSSNEKPDSDLRSRINKVRDGTFGDQFCHVCGKRRVAQMKLLDFLHFCKMCRSCEAQCWVPENGHILFVEYHPYIQYLVPLISGCLKPSPRFLENRRELEVEFDDINLRPNGTYPRLEAVEQVLTLYNMSLDEFWTNLQSDGEFRWQVLLKSYEIIFIRLFQKELQDWMETGSSGNFGSIGTDMSLHAWLAHLDVLHSTTTCVKDRAKGYIRTNYTSFKSTVESVMKATEASVKSGEILQREGLYTRYHHYMPLYEQISSDEILEFMQPFFESVVDDMFSASVGKLEALIRAKNIVIFRPPLEVLDPQLRQLITPERKFNKNNEWWLRRISRYLPYYSHTHDGDKPVYILGNIWAGVLGPMFKNADTKSMLTVLPCSVQAPPCPTMGNMAPLGCRSTEASRMTNSPMGCKALYRHSTTGTMVPLGTAEASGMAHNSVLHQASYPGNTMGNTALLSSTGASRPLNSPMGYGALCHYNTTGNTALPGSTGASRTASNPMLYRSPYADNTTGNSAAVGSAGASSTAYNPLGYKAPHLGATMSNTTAHGPIGYYARANNAVLYRPPYTDKSTGNMMPAAPAGAFDTPYNRESNVAPHTHGYLNTAPPGRNGAAGQKRPSPWENEPQEPSGQPHGAKRPRKSS
ncbi:uncharacterized protein K452DRAFT_316771 [Aplosporella prunicola CBS 121167]|uniref:Uncharacterized protein n=1 Tax=Aplosporella prunicola CBS 121167 TaxID=1176127 RepID=A0A6A6BIP3_9PEZI|nr:uncharacterized protein K452DRAFT_316771 [Aplosporella prunicola CBS 121167]KAF2143989.1 hypothetical protein K452DRAFT_316771 [Aplosporella prunicola CBS 121167]